MPLIHVPWYLQKYLVDCGNADAVVVVNETPAMAAKIAMSDGRAKVAFLALSAIKQKDLSNVIIMRYMLEEDETEQGVTVATPDTQEEWLLRGIPLWVSDSDRGHEGHQKVHASEPAQEKIVTQAPVDKSESTAPKPAPTLPKLKEIAQVVPTQSTVAGEGTPSGGKRQAKEKGKESDKPEVSDDDDVNEDSENDSEQVLEPQQKWMRVPASHFDESRDYSGKDQPKRRAKTAAAAGAEFKPPSRSGAQPSCGTVGSTSG